MYLGGMGGTGKSQVIKALSHFFNERNEAHRFVTLGPTGSSAALLAGSTYHSFLGVNINGRKINKNQIAQIQSRLEGVEYIFIDEVSMLSCGEMYKISAQLSKALGVFDIPFGGMNMVFAGDFAQLPPVGGPSLYSNTVGTQVHAGLKPVGQEAAIGKALWHQVTTVVILRENMRQKIQTAQDEALRTALVNMRYGKCTPEDIRFLRSRIAGKRPGQPNVASKEFRNVAILCGRHTQKDQINMLGCERFAQDTGQKLTNFYSIDKWGKDVDPASKTKWGRSKAAPKTRHQSSEMDFEDQLEIWKLRHGATENFPGKLSLCVGMPVMIRNNDATELCITKGQEGFVAGWQSKIGPHGKRVLDILFVKLDNPPTDVQIEGLPINTVPLAMATKTVSCEFPNDMIEQVERQQLWVLPNFAMTDYASQGKTRHYNVVHLNSCCSHQSYYTCLSRSASADGTIIIQGFDPSKITMGCSGYLRQEFREHEILDDITRLRYEGQLPDHVHGTLRNPLIRSYQKWKGTSYVPENTDTLLSWSRTDPMQLLPVVTDTSWQLVGKSKMKAPEKNTTTSYVPAKGSKPIIGRKCTLDDATSPASKKQKTSHSSEVPVPAKGIKSNAMVRKHTLDQASTSATKRQKKTHDSSDETILSSPLGLQWDENNYSCAYDAFFGILYQVWVSDPEKWSEHFRQINEQYLGLLASQFHQVLQRNISLEFARDEVRQVLHEKYPVMFPMGQVGTSVGDLAFKMLQSDNHIANSQYACLECGTTSASEWDDGFGYKLDADYDTPSSIVEWIAKLENETDQKCPDCSSDMVKQVSYNLLPSILVF